jgi:hypothetical protein
MFAVAANAAPQFIPDKQVVIHRAVESKPERKGELKGPGSGLGSTQPSPPEARRGTGRGAGRPPRADGPPAIRLRRPRLKSAPLEPLSSKPRTARAPRFSRWIVLTRWAKALSDRNSLEGRGNGGRGSIDLSLAVGPDHIFEILGGSMAVFTKKGKKYPSTGKLLYGAVPNNTVFAGFGNRCGVSNNSDAVVRYDQLAQRWLIVVPVFTRPPDNPQGPYAMCYAVSATPDPLGPYYRYEFQRPLFPDYPRPAIWPDGYYLPTSTSDNYLPEVVTQKHECIADRDKMLKGLPATEQCVVIDGGVFMMNTDVDGKRPPPKGAPNIMMSTGGTQLMKIFEDDGIYFYKVHVDWTDPRRPPSRRLKRLPWLRIIIYATAN